jgi:hypothetical protein
VANRRAIYVRSLRIVRGKAMRHDLHEMLVYASMATILLTGFVAWLVVGGSMPSFGPALLDRVAGTRHHWVDTHHFVALLALGLTTNHVRRRWRALLVLVGRARTHCS